MPINSMPMQKLGDEEEQDNELENEDQINQ